MFSRTIIRVMLRAPARPIPRAVPRLPRAPIASPFRPLPSKRFYAQWPRPPRRVWGRVDHEEELRRARPLFTNEQIYNTARSPTTRWVAILSCGSALVFYYMNLEVVPVSGRRRFNCYSDASVEEEGKMLYRMIMDQDGSRMLPDWDRRSRQVKRVMERLIPASGVSDVAWEVHVIDSPERNAFVIPGGKVFVYSGILPITKNDDGLAAVLGHEIAHNLARHAAENLSSTIVLIPLRFALFLGDATGFTLGLGRFLGDLFLQFGIMMPASRQQESEADYIGLLMMAKSCYDPSEAVKFWERMEKANKEEAGFPEWLSTHPSNANRITQIQQWLPAAEAAREDSGCAVSMHQSRAFQDALGGWSGGFWAS